VLQHTDGALAASDGATAVLTRFRRATTLRLQHLQGDGDPQDILEEEDREAALDQAGAADEPLARTIEGFLSRHLEGKQASERPGRRARDRPSPDMVAVSGTEDSAGLSVGLPPGGPAAGALLVSLSGGVDSMVLAHILLCLRHRHRRPVCAVHIDYSNRAESAAEAAYLRSWCETRGVPLQVRTVLEVSRGVTPRDEYERESRRIRFDAYREAMAAHGASAVFFGHHMGDLQENVVSNVMKGAFNYVTTALQCIQQVIGLSKLSGEERNERMVELYQTYVKPEMGTRRKKKRLTSGTGRQIHPDQDEEEPDREDEQGPKLGSLISWDGPTSLSGLGGGLLSLDSAMAYASTETGSGHPERSVSPVRSQASSSGGTLNLETQLDKHRDKLTNYLVFDAYEAQLLRPDV